MELLNRSNNNNNNIIRVYQQETHDNMLCDTENRICFSFYHTPRSQLSGLRRLKNDNNWSK